MKKSHNRKLGVFLVAACLSATVLAETKATESAAKPVYGKDIDWRLLGISHREDKKTLRAILGNDTAITAARTDQTKPWPDGSILAKVVWKESTHPSWPLAIIPGEFASAEAMVKDSVKYASTGGWGFGQWQAGKLVMHDEAKAKECFACHTPMKYNDYVYTFSALK